MWTIIHNRQKQKSCFLFQNLLEMQEELFRNSYPFIMIGQKILKEEEIPVSLSNVSTLSDHISCGNLSEIDDWNHMPWDYLVKYRHTTNRIILYILESLQTVLPEDVVRNIIFQYFVTKEPLLVYSRQPYANLVMQNWITVKNLFCDKCGVNGSDVNRLDHERNCIQKEIHTVLDRCIE